MNDNITKKKYRRRELILAIAFSIMIFLDLGSPFFPNHIIGIVFHELFFVFTLICFCVLMHQLKHYHRYEYIKNKKNLFVVFIFTILYHYLYLFFGFFRDSIDRTTYSIISPITMAGFCPFLLAYIFVRMKNSQDPLEGISKLDVMMLVSRNQRITKRFAPNLYHSVQWKNLNDKERTEFQNIFMDN